METVLPLLVRKRQMEALIDRLPGFPEARADWEQYRTPGPLALILVQHAFEAGDIKDRIVFDLGSGTGPLTLAATILGAAKVVAVDRDLEALKRGRQAMITLWPGLEVDWVLARLDRGGLRVAGDATVIMNPPFGAQSRGADGPFLEAALRGRVAYLFHHVVNEKWLVSMAESVSRGVEKLDEVQFPIRAQYRHHRKKVVEVPVGIYRLSRL